VLDLAHLATVPLIVIISALFLLGILHLGKN